MRSRVVTVLALAVGSILLAGCMLAAGLLPGLGLFDRPATSHRSPEPAEPSLVLPLASGEVALPVLLRASLAPGAVWACAGVGLLDAVLHGDPADPKVAWLVSQGSRRIDLLWPSGYRARFVPGLEVLDEHGAVVGREGDHVDGACVTGDPDVLSMEPPLEISSPSPSPSPPSSPPPSGVGLTGSSPGMVRSTAPSATALPGGSPTSASPWTPLAASDTAGASWSPDGQWLLVWSAVTNGTPEQDHLFLADSDGAKVRDLPGQSAVWLDARSFVVFQGSSQVLGSVGDDKLEPISVSLPAYVLSSGHGALAFRTTARDSAEQFAVWQQSGRAQPHFGEPEAWSRDGSKLAVWHFATPGTGTGGQPTGWVNVLTWPGLTSIAVDRSTDTLWSPMAFDPTGRYLAFFSTGQRPVHVLDLTSGSVSQFGPENASQPLAWNAHHQLLVASDDGSIATYDATGARLDLQVGTGDSVVASADGSRVAGYFWQQQKAMTLFDDAAIQSIDVPGAVQPHPLLSSNGTEIVIFASSDGMQSVLLRHL